MKIWIWGAAGLLVANLAIVGLVVFLVRRDSISPNHSQSQSEQRLTINEQSFVLSRVECDEVL